MDLSGDPLVDLVFASISLLEPRLVRVAAGVDAGVLTATVVLLAERDRKKVRAFTNLALYVVNFSGTPDTPLSVADSATEFTDRIHPSPFFL
jgi:hypothetical protein